MTKSIQKIKEKQVSAKKTVKENPTDLLNLRQRKFLEAYLKEGQPTYGNAFKSAEAAGYFDGNQAYYLMQSPKVREAINYLLDKQGISDFKLTKVLSEGLDATKTVIDSTEDGKPITEEVADYGTRHKYLETALKLKDHYPTQQNQDKEQKAQLEGIIIKVFNVQVNPDSRITEMFPGINGIQP